ncbi:hypothetical protein B296_00004780, partial [Ensete ventricosum]
KGCSNLTVFLVESACGNAALSSVCAQGRDDGGHAADGPGRTLGRSRVGSSRIKRRRVQQRSRKRRPRMPPTTTPYASGRRHAERHADRSRAPMATTVGKESRLGLF